MESFGRKAIPHYSSEDWCPIYKANLTKGFEPLNRVLCDSKKL